MIVYSEDVEHVIREALSLADSEIDKAKVWRETNHYEPAARCLFSAAAALGGASVALGMLEPCQLYTNLVMARNLVARRLEIASGVTGLI